MSGKRGSQTTSQSKEKRAAARSDRRVAGKDVVTKRKSAATRKPKRKPCMSHPFSHLVLVMDLRRPGFVELDRKVVKLGSRAWNLLYELARHGGEVVRRESLFNAVWTMANPPESAQLDGQLLILRARFEKESPGRRSLIVTFHGQGVMLDLSPNQIVLLPHGETEKS